VPGFQNEDATRQSFPFFLLSKFSAAGEFIFSYWQKFEWFLSYLITKYEFLLCRNHHILHQVPIGSQQYRKMLKFSYFHILAKFYSVVLWIGSQVLHYRIGKKKKKKKKKNQKPA
jgi:hypothetical protein